MQRVRPHFRTLKAQQQPPASRTRSGGPWCAECACSAQSRGGAGGHGAGGEAASSRGHWAGASARGSGAGRGGASASGRCGSRRRVTVLAGPRSSQVRWSPRKRLRLCPWLLEGALGGVRLLRARRLPAASPFPAAAMTKGGVVERSQTGALHATPAGDKAAGTRGPSAPGGGDRLKGE